MYYTPFPLIPQQELSIEKEFSGHYVQIPQSLCDRLDQKVKKKGEARSFLLPAGAVDGTIHYVWEYCAAGWLLPEADFMEA